MSVIKTRGELAEACGHLSNLHPTIQAATETLESLTAQLDGTTNTESKTALDKLRQAAEAVGQARSHFALAGDALTRYGDFI